ncbi:MAG: Asp-tRNA(Asn)/Glu-tRNA(Gln) amidotransferase subunit GatC [Methylococcaceae bacterium]|nr:Asp-tRNA(Asn)/Glu-tRNA(Gln) amidotransferase subunit GatC [Methylococcaceae bacterium]MCI0732227.1 Asp-tRNA(Asn)/Glu-tRNA(Gln) amidotransferase subunit GatC [Methylococcaceae bacterium]
MSHLSADDVKNIAWLARIRVDPGDIDGYARDLSGILELVDQLNSADTAGITPMAHPLDQSQRMRADRVTEENQRELFQSQAPQVEAGLYLVPKVIE